MEFVSLEILMRLATGLMPSLASRQCEQRTNRRFRSFFCTSIDTCVDLWILCYGAFDKLTMHVCLLCTLMFFKQHSTEEANAGRDRVHEGIFRYWFLRVLTAISNAEFASVIHDHVMSVLTIF